MVHDVPGASGGRNTPISDANDVLGATGGRNALVLPVDSNVAERSVAVARAFAWQETQEEHPIAAADVVPDSAGRQLLQLMLTDVSALVQPVQLPKMSIGIRDANAGIMAGWFPVDSTIALRKLWLDYCATCGFHPSQAQFHWHVDGQQIRLNSSAMQLGLISGDILDVVFLSVLLHWRDLPIEPDPEPSLPDLDVLQLQ